MGRRLVVAGVLAGATLVVGSVQLARPQPEAASRPPATSAPRASMAAPASGGPGLTPAGFGRVQLDMPVEEYRSLYSTDGSGWDLYLRVSSRDDTTGCLQYEPSSITSGAPRTWVWVRDGRVVTVGVTVARGGLVVDTAFGLSLGEPLRASDYTSNGGWVADDDSPLTAIRSNQFREDASVLLISIADTDDDGLADYASVGTTAGDECVFNPRSVPAVDALPAVAPPDAPRIDGSGVLGVSIGMPTDEVLAQPGWTEQSLPTMPCNVFVAAPSVAAYAAFGRVVGLSGPRVSGVVSIGEPVEDMTGMTGLVGTYVNPPSADGPETRVSVARDAAVVAGIDRPVTATSLLSPPVAVDLLVGQRCSTAETETGMVAVLIDE